MPEHEEEKPPLLLPSSAGDAATELDADSGAVKLDALGPMVVNSDGVSLY